MVSCGAFQRWQAGLGSCALTFLLGGSNGVTAQMLMPHPNPYMAADPSPSIAPQTTAVQGPQGWVQVLVDSTPASTKKAAKASEQVAPTLSLRPVSTPAGQWVLEDAGAPPAPGSTPIDAQQFTVRSNTAGQHVLEIKGQGAVKKSPAPVAMKVVDLKQGDRNRVNSPTSPEPQTLYRMVK